MAKSIQTVKKGKKLWYPIYAPKIMNNEYLGETYSYDKEKIEGKTLKLNLSTLTGNIKKQNIDVKFKVTAFAENKATTTITGVELTNSYIKRLVRRGRDKIDDSFSTMTKDKKIVRIKPLITTMNRTGNSVNSKIRLEARKLIGHYIKGKTYEEFFSDTLGFRFQKEIKETLSKIYPVKTFEIRRTHLEPDTVKPTLNPDTLKEIQVRAAPKKIKKKQEPEKDENTKEDTKTGDELEEETQDADEEQEDETLEENDEDAMETKENELEGQEENKEEEGDEDNPKN
ncbi:hypothetical protein K9L97_05905 [Candidatus Woesearchaeota archaeon]|nr:hypothetical protein [Candidatus Woesearchaeota archaeon]